MINDKTIMWLMCACYVWPTYAMYSAYKEYDGRCERCGGGCRVLSYMINTREEAEDVFFENYHRPVTPIP